MHEQMFSVDCLQLAISGYMNYVLYVQRTLIVVVLLLYVTVDQLESSYYGRPME